MITKKELLERFETPSEHHPLGASAADRWMTCPASLRATIDLPDSSSPAAQEGTEAHAEAERHLNAGTDSSDEFVQVYLDYVRALGGELWVEQKINLTKWIHSGFGTADAIVLDGDHLHVVDLKYGTGIRVSAVDSKQLQIYGIGAYTALKKIYPNISQVTLHIVQPRLFHIESWGRTPDELMEFADVVYRASQACIAEAPAYNPSDKGCQWCNAKGNCPALYDHCLAIVGDDFDDVATVPTVTPEQIAWLLDNKKLITQWLAAAGASAVTIMEAGGDVPGYKLAEAKTMAKWGPTAPDILEKELGDDAFVTKLKTQGDITKIIGKAKFNKLGLTVKKVGLPVAVREDDPRPTLTAVVDSF